MSEDKKLTIGLFIDVYYPMVDGVVVVVDNYAKELSKKANVIVFAPGTRDKKYVDAFPYPLIRSKRVRLPFMEYDISLPFFDRKFRKTLRNSKLDIVHIHSPFAICKTGLSYAKKHKVPVIATMHSQYKKDFLERTKSEIVSEIAIKEIMNTFNKCDECWAVNNKVADIFVEYGANTRPKIQLNATDLIPLSDLSLVEKQRKNYAIQPDEKVFLYVGRLDTVKNLGFTIHALTHLKEYRFKFKMIFIGKGPYETEMKQLIKKNHLTDHVIFAGRVMDRIELASYYKLADLFLFPSFYDSSSLVQIEAASQSIPTLFLKGAATADTITEDVNGYLSEDNPKLYAEKIIDIFQHQDQYETISKQAFRDLYQTWDQATETVYQKYLDLIKDYEVKNSK